MPTKKQLKLRLTKTPLERFTAKLVFNPFTGCVMWAGGTTSGGGKSTFYPTFWDGTKMVRGHIWAAENIHGIVREPGHHIDHECRNTLCVHHLRQLPGETNSRMGAEQQYHEKRFWDGPPFYRPPEWCPKDMPTVMAPKEFYAVKRKLRRPKRKKRRKKRG